MLKRLWRDEGGAVLSVELILLLVILVIGLVVGMTALRDAITLKYVELAGAVGSINPAYRVTGILMSNITCGGGAVGGAGIPQFGFIDSGLTGSGLVAWTSCPTAFASALTINTSSVP